MIPVIAEQGTTTLAFSLCGVIMCDVEIPGVSLFHTKNAPANLVGVSVIPASDFLAQVSPNGGEVTYLRACHGFGSIGQNFILFPDDGRFRYLRQSG